MRLYLLRHGKADWPHWEGEDGQRPLTDEGKREMRWIGAALRTLKVDPEIIFTSPLPRASQTAEIAGKELGVAVRKEDSLQPGFGLEECRALLAGHREGDAMLVGHEPDFSGLVAALTGADIRLAKAGVAAIELEEPWEKGRLLWMMPGKLMIRLYR